MKLSLRSSLSTFSLYPPTHPPHKKKSVPHHPDVMARRLRLVQRDVLPDEHADPDPREIKTVEERVDLGQLVQARQPPLPGTRASVVVVLAKKLLLQLGHAHRHHGHHVLVPLVDRPQQIRKSALVVGVLDFREPPQVGERANVPVSDFKDVRLRAEAVGEVF